MATLDEILIKQRKFKIMNIINQINNLSTDSKAFFYEMITSSVLLGFQEYFENDSDNLLIYHDFSLADEDDVQEIGELKLKIEDPQHIENISKIFSGSLNELKNESLRFKSDGDIYLREFLVDSDKLGSRLVNILFSN
jgi:hypothetical protein